MVCKACDLACVSALRPIEIYHRSITNIYNTNCLVIYLIIIINLLIVLISLCLLLIVYHYTLLIKKIYSIFSLPQCVVSPVPFPSHLSMWNNHYLIKQISPLSTVMPNPMEFSWFYYFYLWHLILDHSLLYDHFLLVLLLLLLCFVHISFLCQFFFYLPTQGWRSAGSIFDLMIS